jgi:hypothetical protein
MKIRIREADGLWMTKHINPKNLEKIKRKYVFEIVEATTTKPTKPNPAHHPKISPPA